MAKRKCPICGKEIYTGTYCIDCMYSDTRIVSKFEKELIKLGRKGI